MSKRQRREKPCVECDGCPPRESPGPLRFPRGGETWTTKEADALRDSLGPGDYPDRIDLLLSPDGVPAGISPPGIVADIVASDPALFSPHILWVIFLARSAVSHSNLPPNLTAWQIKTWMIIQFDAIFATDHWICYGLADIAPEDSDTRDFYFMLQSIYLKAFALRKRYEGGLFVDPLYVPPERRKEFEALCSIPGMMQEQIVRMAQALREK